MSEEDKNEVSIEALDALLVLAGLVSGLRPWEMLYFDVFEIPTKNATGNGLSDGWEGEAYPHCWNLVHIEKVVEAAEELAPQLEFIGRNLADIRKICRRTKGSANAALAAITAKQLTKGNFDAPRMVSVGLSNLRDGKAFRPRTGPKKSADLFLTLRAFCELKKFGIERPSQAEVKAHLAGQGYPIGKDRLSKNFDELGLRDEASDAREAMSEAGQRKRKRT